MKNILFIITIALIASSCVETRIRSATSSNSSDYTDAYTDDSSTTTTTTTTDDEEDDDDTTTSIPSDASHCTWATSSSSTYSRDTDHLGNINICQSSTNELKIYLQAETALTSTRVCVIPMASTGSSKTIYVGNPRCSTLPVSGNIYSVTLYKNRSGYTDYSVTGVMLIKDTNYTFASPYSGTWNAVNAFLFCSQYLDSTGNSAYCDSFKALNQYVYQSFTDS